jgi:threonine/homoserine/homoserine lactone efflux protein
MIPYILSGITFAFAAAVQPGPFQAYLFSRTLSSGWRRTFPAIFAPLISDGPIIALVLFMLSRIPEGLIVLLRFAGGMFLLYLAWAAFRTWREFNPGSETEPRAKNTLWQAVLVNFFNPNPYLGWSLVMGPMLLQGWRESPPYSIALLGSFYLMMIVTTLGLLLLFDSARQFGDRVRKVLIGLSALALAGFGLYQLAIGIQFFI